LSFSDLASIQFHENEVLSIMVNGGRRYRMLKRAKARERTRERIVQATMQLHDEKGVAQTTFSEIAKRAGVGPATVSRHFPTLGELVRACGRHVWEEMRPPSPETTPAVFVGAQTQRERLVRLVEELDAFYTRGELRLGLAARDREIVPELDGFLIAVEAGVEALVREALAGTGRSQLPVQVAKGLMSYPMWLEVRRLGLPQSELTELKVRLLECGISAARQVQPT
jgi:AcrR family transcriptional regulator